MFKILQITSSVREDTPLGPLVGPGIVPEENVGQQIASIISTIIGIFTVLAIIWFIIEFVIAGYLMVSSAGDQEKTAEAKKRLTQSLFGLIIVISAIFFISLVSFIAGIDFLNIAEYINRLTF